MTTARLFRTYVGRSQLSVDEVRRGLWTSTDGTAYQANGGELFQAAIMEQYKIYVDAADRLSARRATTNTFFLTLNTAIIAVAGGAVKYLQHVRAWDLTVPFVMIILQCLAWFWILRSYRQLSSAKFRVIGALEERLPASPFWSAEWIATGAGKDKSLYWPASSLEMWVPLTFAAAYTAVFVLVLAQ